MLLLEEKLGGWIFSSWSPSGLICVHKTIVSQVVCGLNGMRQTALITVCCDVNGDFVMQWHVFYVQVTVQRDNFRKNNQLDASISNIYFCHKTLHVSGIFCDHHQELSTVHMVIGTLHAGYVTASLAESGWT